MHILLPQWAELLNIALSRKGIEAILEYSSYDLTVLDHRLMHLHSSYDLTVLDHRLMRLHRSYDLTILDHRLMRFE